MGEYRKAIEAVWDVIDIYQGPEVFSATFGTVPPEVGLLYAAHFCQSEVCNGGFTQFFWNSTGVLAPEAVRGFVAIGLPQIADITQKAIAMLGEPYRREREARKKALRTLIPEPDNSPRKGDVEEYRNVEAFGSLEDEFYGLLESENGGFEAASSRYAAGLLFREKGRSEERDQKRSEKQVND